MTMQTITNALSAFYKMASSDTCYLCSAIVFQREGHVPDKGELPNKQTTEFIYYNKEGNVSYKSLLWTSLEAAFLRYIHILILPPKN